MTATTSKHVNPVPGPAKSNAKLFYDLIRGDRRPSSWFDAKGIATDTQQTLASRAIEGDTPSIAVMGSSAVDTVSDPVRLPHTGEHYVYVPATAGNFISATSPFTNTASWSSKVVGKLRCTPNTTPSRPATVGFQGFLNWTGTQWQVIYRSTADAYATLAGVTNPFGGVGVLQDVGFEITPTTVYVYVRVPTGKLSDQAADSWSGWTLIQTSAVTSLPGSGISNIIGSNGGSNSWCPYPIYEAIMKIDAQEVTFDPSTQIDTSADPDAGQASFGGWTVNRAAAGLKTAVVTRPVMLPDGIDDFVQLPASDTPTFTRTTGRHTVVVAIRSWDTSTSPEFIYSSESSQDDGVVLWRTGTDLKVRSASGTPVDATLVGAVPLGVLTVIAIVQDNGGCRCWSSSAGFSTPLNTTSGTAITHGTPKVGRRAFSTQFPARSSVFACLTFKDQALTATELDAFAEQLLAGDY